MTTDEILVRPAEIRRDAHCRCYFDLLMAAFLLPLAAAGQIAFEEVTETAGVSNPTPQSYGASWGDLNGDGRPDLFTLGHRTADTARLHLNNGDGTFTDVLHQYLNFVDQDQHAASWVDFDNDGDQDILQMGGGGKIGMADPSANELFVNEGGMLVDEASARGIDYPAGRGRMSLWFDWNGDGELDVLLANLERPDGTYPSALFTSTAASSSRTMPSPASPRHGATRSRIFRISQPKRFRRWFCMGRLIQCTSIGPIPYLLLT